MKRPWYVEWYGPPAPADEQPATARFRTLYPDSVWLRMTPVEQAQARAAWEGQQQAIAATRESGDRTRAMLLTAFIAVPAVLAMIYLLIATLAAGV
jgi:hypothetical protein